MNKPIKITIVVLLVLILVSGILAGVTKGFQDWSFGKTTHETPVNEGSEDIETAFAEQLEVTNITQGKVMYLAAAEASAASETGVTLTATITPASATDKSVDWTVSFVNASSSWANGKNASDYINVTPTSDGALTATVLAKQAFGEQIKITVTSRVNSEATASCVVDYGARLNNVASISFSNIVFASNSTISSSGVQSVETIRGGNWQGMFAMYANGTFTYTPEYGSHTKDSATATATVFCKPTDEFYAALKAKGLAKTSNSWVSIPDCNLKQVYESMCNATLVPLNGQSTQCLTDINTFNSAVVACSGSYDFELKVSVNTDYESKDYIFQCKFNRSGSAFTATSMSLSSSSIVL